MKKTGRVIVAHEDSQSWGYGAEIAARIAGLLGVTLGWRYSFGILCFLAAAVIILSFRLPRIPRFSIWCGTRLTENWHLRYRAEVVIYGHLHIRGSYRRDGVRFEEVSLGYPREWRRRSEVPPFPLSLIWPSGLITKVPRRVIHG